MEIDCRVLAAENGVQALQILSQTPVDVVLADIRMSQMDGLPLLVYLKSESPSVPCTAETINPDVP